MFFLCEHINITNEISKNNIEIWKISHSSVCIPACNFPLICFIFFVFSIKLYASFVVFYRDQPSAIMAHWNYATRKEYIYKYDTTATYLHVYSEYLMMPESSRMGICIELAYKRSQERKQKKKTIRYIVQCAKLITQLITNNGRGPYGPRNR